MKTRILLVALFIALFVSGCVVFSFYPLYTENDLFPNEILTGTWTDDDNEQWRFEHPTLDVGGQKSIDETSYILTMRGKDEPEFGKTEYSVHIIQLGGHYFLDFYLKNYWDKDELQLADFHVVPVHTFAKLTITGDSLHIQWFSQEWLGKLIDGNKTRIRHEKNNDCILLTARPAELQKFVSKFADSGEAFDGGMDVMLTRD